MTGSDGFTTAEFYLSLVFLGWSSEPGKLSHAENQWIWTFQEYLLSLPPILAHWISISPLESITNIVPLAWLYNIIIIDIRETVPFTSNLLHYSNSGQKTKVGNLEGKLHADFNNVLPSYLKFHIRNICHSIPGLDFVVFAEGESLFRNLAYKD